MNISNFKKDLMYIKLDRNFIYDKYLFISQFHRMSSPGPEYKGLGFDSNKDLEDFKTDCLSYVTKLQNQFIKLSLKEVANKLAESSTESEINYLLAENKKVSQQQKQQMCARFYDYYLDTLLKLNEENI